ncbi:hypothetical protein KCP74_06200 [Salmonella enterica subsp. enterica]|nr:hypothetical protein KCP74_06200 [Salmonella enterica subsp. enterica]
MLWRWCGISASFSLSLLTVLVRRTHAGGRCAGMKRRRIARETLKSLRFSGAPFWGIHHIKTEAGAGF